MKEDNFNFNGHNSQVNIVIGNGKIKKIQNNVSTIDIITNSKINKLKTLLNYFEIKLRESDDVAIDYKTDLVNAIKIYINGGELNTMLLKTLIEILEDFSSASLKSVADDIKDNLVDLFK